MSKYGARFYVKVAEHERDVPEWRVMHATETFAEFGITMSEQLADGTYEVRTFGTWTFDMARRIIDHEGLVIFRYTPNTSPLDALLTAV